MTDRPQLTPVSLLEPAAPPDRGPLVRWRCAAARISPVAYAAPAIALVVISLVLWPPATWSSVVVVVGLIGLAQLGTFVGVSLNSGRISGDFPVLLVLAALEPPSAAILGAAILTMTENIVSRDAVLSRLHINFSALVIPISVAAIGCEIVRQTGLSQVGTASYALVVLLVFCVALLLNFVIAFAPDLDDDRQTMRSLMAELFLPLAPHHLMLGIAVSVVTIGYARYGAAVVGFGAITLLGFGWIVGELMAGHKRMQDLEQFSISTLHTLLRSISLRDQMTARHSAAVARYAQLIALELNADPTWVRQVVKPAGVLHDVGKHLFPDSILKGDSRLTDEEFEIVKMHPVAGWELIRKLPGYGEIAEIVRHHHERIDGRGYPDGIAGDDIPLASRCISVADTFDVMTARDTYRDPVSVEDAVAELKKVAGSQLDARCVEAFLRVLDREPKNVLMFDHSGDADLLRSLQDERAA